MNDDVINLQSAIDRHWNAAESRVEIPRAAYLIDEPLRVWRAVSHREPHPADCPYHLTIDGRGAIIDTTAHIPIFEILGGWIVTLENFRLRGGDYGVTVNMGRRQGAKPSRGVTIRNCVIEDAVYGVHIGDEYGPDVTQWQVKNCVIQNCNTGLKAIGANVDGTITRTTIGGPRNAIGVEVHGLKAPDPPDGLPPGNTNRGGSPRVTCTDLTTSTRGVLFQTRGPATLEATRVRAEGAGTFATIDPAAPTNSRFHSVFRDCWNNMGQGIRLADGVHATHLHIDGGKNLNLWRHE